jgi:hypothetical protein
MTGKLTKEKFHKISYSNTFVYNSEASKTLGGLKNCPMEILQGLANLATDNAAFGSTDLWTPSQVNKELN